jgi:hypothetical protein
MGILRDASDHCNTDSRQVLVSRINGMRWQKYLRGF